MANVASTALNAQVSKMQIMAELHKLVQSDNQEISQVQPKVYSHFFTSPVEQFLERNDSEEAHLFRVLDRCDRFEVLTYGKRWRHRAS